MTGPARFCADLTGWRRAVLAILLGAGTSLAFAPYFLLPLLVVGSTGLIWLLDGARRPTVAFFIGWCFGFGHFLVGLYWIGHAFLVDADRFAWLLPFAVSLLPAGLALFIGVVTLVVHAAGGGRWQRIAVLALAWTLAEWFRAHLFTGFPWNLVGYVWAFSDAMLQPAAWFGVYGLSLLTVAAAAAPAALANGWRSGLPACLGLIAVLAAAGGYGHFRLSDPLPEDVADIRLRIVQPNVAQRDKWRPELRDGHLARLLELSTAAADRPPTHIVWPETATPFLLAADTRRRHVIGQMLQPERILISGAPRRDIASDGGRDVWNSLHVMGPGGTLLATYDKHHLVPFGEYLPFRPLLSAIGLSKLTAGSRDFSSGPGPAVVDIPGLPSFQPLICYEVIFPHQIAPARRPAWLLNVTNDAWFGDGGGPRQHFAMARVRAIEQGVPLIRAANTGISGVIDAYGRPRATLDLGASGVIDSALPGALPSPPLYARLGDRLLMPVLAMILLYLFWRRFWRLKKDTTKSGDAAFHS